MSEFSDLSHTEIASSDQSESNNFAQDDFERLDHDAVGVYESGPIPEQDEEITTTNNAFGGEEPAEEDRYAAGASEDAAQSSSDPLISWGDEENESLPQPSAAVPDSQGSALDDLGGLAMGALASAGAQSAFKSPSPPDPYPSPPQESEAVSNTEPVSEAPQESKVAGKSMTARFFKWLLSPFKIPFMYWKTLALASLGASFESPYCMWMVIMITISILFSFFLSRFMIRLSLPLGTFCLTSSSLFYQFSQEWHLISKDDIWCQTMKIHCGNFWHCGRWSFKCVSVSWFCKFVTLCDVVCY